MNDEQKQQDTTSDENRTTRRPTTESRHPPGYDARHDKGQLKKNQERLGVGTDHKTPSMKKHHRGTFP